MLEGLRGVLEGESMGEATGAFGFASIGVGATGISWGAIAIGVVTGILVGTVGTQPPVGHSQFSPSNPLLQVQRQRETQGPELADTQCDAHGTSEKE